MIDNERIAEWAGLTVADVLGSGLRITNNDPKFLRPWSPDTDITCWHGPDGLLWEIYKRGRWIDFILAYEELAIIRCEFPRYSFEETLEPKDPRDLEWRFVYMAHEAIHLAAALVKMIEESND